MNKGENVLVEPFEGKQPMAGESRMVEEVLHDMNQQVEVW